MRRQVFVFLLLVLITVVGGYVAGCATATGQPHMNAALNELQSAREELNSATADKGGHREKALGLVDQAINEVQAGIDFARR